jgi:hypothetical protein
MDREAGKKTVEQAKTHIAPSAEKKFSVERGCLPRSLTHSRKHVNCIVHMIVAEVLL